MNNCKILLYILFPFLILCIQCRNKESEWKHVKNIDQYLVYRHFLKDNPGTGYKEEITQRIDTLKQAWHPEMQDVTSLSLIIDESFPEGYDFSIGRSQVKTVLKEIMNHADFDVIEESNKRTDAILKVTIVGKPRGAHYIGTKGIQYSGASIFGDLRLIKNEKEIARCGFMGKEGTPGTIYHTYENKTDAPFFPALSNSSIPFSLYRLINQVTNIPPNFLAYMFFGGRGYISGEGNLLYLATGPTLKVIDVETKKERWEFKTESNIRTKPIVTCNTVYFKTDTDIFALNKRDGSLRWKYFWIDYNRRLVTASSRIVCAVTDNGKLHVLDAETGVLKWDLELMPSERHKRFRPAISENTVCIGSLGSKGRWVYLFAFDAEDGTVKWKFRTSDDIRSVPVIDRNIVYFGCSDNYFYALNEKDGSLRWKYRTGGEIHSDPIIINNTVYIGSNDKCLYAFETDNGNLKWRYKTKGPVNVKPFVSNETVYLNASNTLYAINSNDGRLNWKFEDKDSKYFKIGPLAAGSTVYTGYAHLFALDAKGGLLKWKFNPYIGLASFDMVVFDQLLEPVICLYSWLGDAYFLSDEINKSK